MGRGGRGGRRPARPPRGPARLRGRGRAVRRIFGGPWRRCPARGGDQHVGARGGGGGGRASPGGRAAGCGERGGGKEAAAPGCGERRCCGPARRRPANLAGSRQLLDREGGRKGGCRAWVTSGVLSLLIVRRESGHPEQNLRLSLLRRRKEVRLERKSSGRGKPS